MESPADLANIILLKRNVAGWSARLLYRNVELKHWQQAHAFFSILQDASRTKLYRAVELVENIQVAFSLDLFQPFSASIPKEQSRATVRKQMRFMDCMQYGLHRLIRLQSLNIFISSAKKDPFGLIRVANILYEHGPPQPIIVRLKIFGIQTLAKVQLQSGSL